MKILRTSLLVAAVLALSAPALARPHHKPRPIDPEFEKLHHEITLLNLINGLELEPGQAAAWLEVVREAQEQHAEFEAQIKSRQAAARPMLEKVKEALMRGEAPPEELRTTLHELRKEGRPLMREHRETMRGLGEKALGALSEDQRVQLRDFRPGPRRDKRPARGKRGPGAIQHLQRARQADDAEFEEAWEHRKVSRARQLERALGPDGDVTMVENRLRQIIDRARALDDEEFEQQADDLAQEIMDLHQPADKLRGPHVGRRLHLLLSPELISILEARAG